MFDKLSASLQKVFKNLRGYGKLTERNVQDALREVRLALLEADVNFQVARGGTALRSPPRWNAAHAHCWQVRTCGLCRAQT